MVYLFCSYYNYFRGGKSSPNPWGVILFLNYSILYINPRKLNEEVSSFKNRRSDALELLSKLFGIPTSNIESFAKKIGECLEESMECRETGKILFLPFDHPFNVPYNLVLFHLATNFACNYSGIYGAGTFSLNKVVAPSETDYLWGMGKLRRARDGTIVIEREQNKEIIGRRVPEEIYRMRTEEIVKRADCRVDIDKFLIRVTEELYQHSTKKDIPIMCFSGRNVIIRSLEDMSKIEGDEVCRILPKHYYPLFLTLSYITREVLILLSHEFEEECEEERSRYYQDEILGSSKKFVENVIDPTVKLLERHGIRGNVIRVDSTILAGSFIKEIERGLKDEIIAFGHEKGKLDNLSEETKKQIYHVLLFQTSCEGECLDRYLKYEIDPHDTDSFVAQSAEILGRLLIETYLGRIV